MSSPVVLGTIGAEMEPTTLPPPESVAEKGPSTRPGRHVFSRARGGRGPSLERRQARLSECPEILHAGLPPLSPLLAPALRVNYRRAHDGEGRRPRSNRLPHRFPPLAPSF